MTGRLALLLGWLALAGFGALACTSPKPTPIANAPPQDASASDAAKGVLVHFELVPSAKGARTLELVVDSADQRTPLGEVPAGALCEPDAQRKSDVFLAPPENLYIACGGGLNARVTSEPVGLKIAVRHGFNEDEPTSTQMLPLPPGTHVEFRDSLQDPAPIPACDGHEQAEVTLALDRLQRPFLTQARIRASVPVEARIEVPACDRTCVGKRDDEGKHYEYVCRCSSEPHATGIVVDIRDGALFTKTYSSEPCTGHAEQHGGWRLPCGARMRFPPGTEILPYKDHGFEDSPEEIRAQREGERKFERRVGL